MRGPGRTSEGLDAVAGARAAQSETQRMLANFGQDPAKQAADQANKTRQQELRKRSETRQIEKYITELREKEEKLTREQAPKIEAQKKESERLAMIKGESVRHERLLKGDRGYQVKFAKEQAEAEAKAKREAEVNKGNNTSGVRARSEATLEPETKRTEKRKERYEEEDPNRDPKKQKTSNSSWFVLGLNSIFGGNTDDSKNIINNSASSMVASIPNSLFGLWSSHFPPSVPDPTPKPIIVEKTPQITVNEKIILAFKNKSDPQNSSDLNEYFEACNFIRLDNKNFEAFKEKLLREDVSGEAEKSGQQIVLTRAKHVCNMIQDDYDFYCKQKKSNLPPQKNPPETVDTSTAKTTQRREVPKVAPVAIPSNTQSQKTNASQYYSHSLDICRLQEKFDNHNNISYNQIKNSKDYFDRRVAKWDEELKGLHVETRPPRQKNEPRNMGFNGYVEYLNINIKKLKLKEDDTSVNQEQLQTLIAFHYLEITKAFYSSGQLHLEGIEGDFYKKQNVFNGVPKKYRGFLLNEKFQISQNSYTLPNLEKEPDPEFPQFSSQLNKPPAMIVRVRSAINSTIEGARELAQNEAAFIRDEMGGRGVVAAAKAVRSGAGRVGGALSGALDRAGGAIVSTGVRAAPNKSRPPQNEFITSKSGLGYGVGGLDVNEYNSHLRKERDIESKLQRDTRPGALAQNKHLMKLETEKAILRQARGDNFYGPYNKRHGGGR